MTNAQETLSKPEQALAETGTKEMRYYVGQGEERTEVALSTSLVRQMWAPKASPIECLMFMQLCRTQRLNPFVGEVYIIKYAADQPAAFVVGKATYMRRASEHPMFEGFEAGIIVTRPDANGERVEDYINGERIPTGATLIGGWARAHRKDRKFPLEAEVSLKTFDKAQSQWKSMPEVMIRKVALCHCLREAFPEAFAGLYDASEVDATNPREQDIVDSFALPHGDLALESVETGMLEDALEEEDEIMDQALNARNRDRQAVEEAMADQTSQEAFDSMPSASDDVR